MANPGSTDPSGSANATFFTVLLVENFQEKDAIVHDFSIRPTFSKPNMFPLSKACQSQEKLIGKLLITHPTIAQIIQAKVNYDLRIPRLDIV
jgi:hypothetical protein